MMTITCKYGKQLLTLELDENVTKVKHLKELLLQETNARIETIKLIVMGNVLQDDYEMETLCGAEGLRIGETNIKIESGTIVTMIGLMRSHEVVQEPKAHETVRVINDLSTDGVQSQVHPLHMSYAPKQERTNSEYSFKAIETLKGLPDEDKARAILESLASDQVSTRCRFTGISYEYTYTHIPEC